MRYQVTEEYIDCLCPSGENDTSVNHEVIEANSEREAIEIYKRNHTIDMNNQVRARIWDR